MRGLAPDGEVTDATERMIRYSLARYADLLRPWARSVAAFMIADVDRRNERAWKELSQEMGKALAIEIKQAPTGMLYEALMADQVELITSLPTQAAERVQKLVTEQSLIGGQRSTTLAKEILRTEQVTKARATLIARTETSRAASNLTQARAMFAGSTEYIWRTSGDGDVRPTHKAMDGKTVKWDSPPKTDANLDPYHAGCGPNCRCFPDPILPFFD